MGLDGAAAATADDGVLPGGLASLVRDGRQAARLTQLQLAAAAGVSIGVVRDLEQGRTARPRQRSVTRIAAALGVPADLTAPGSGGPPRGVRLQVLGSLAAWRDGEEVALGPARERAVLGLLAARPNSVVRREAICEALWDGGPPATALAMVQSYVGRLRRLLGPPRGPGGAGGLLLATGSGYRLQVTHEQLDLIEFMRVCARAREAARAGRHEVACARYEEALALWQGEPLADIDALRGHPAVSGLAGSGRRPWRTTPAPCPHRAGTAGRWAAADPGGPRAAERAGARAPDRGPGGQQAAALAAFDAVRRRLDDQLGVRPGADLAAAHERVLHQRIPAAAAAAPW